MRTVSLTLRSLFCQSVRPDRFILWIDHGSFPDLPDSVLSFIDRGLEIRETEIQGPLGKYLPARNEFPDAVIVTADDDNLYWMSWLNELILAWNGHNDQIVCHRAHRILFDRNGLPLPYSSWAYETRTQLGADLFPTGCMGVLYPPGCHHSDVRDMEKHNRLCPKADDIWLYWMGRLAGASYRNIASIGDDRRQQIQWPGTQENCLAAQNISKGNDIQLDNMIREYGWMSCYNTVINSDVWMKCSKLLLWDNLIKKVKLCICAKLDVDVINVFDVDYLGIIFYGPYLSLEPGNYVIKIELSTDSGINITGLKAEVCHAFGH